MQLLNHTCFPALAFLGIDIKDQEYHVVVVRTTYRLETTSVRGELNPVLMESDAPPLELEDRHTSTVGESSLLCESDLAPFKPRCDVLLTGSAHAPEGQDVHQWPVRLRVARSQHNITAPQAATPFLIDKSLLVHGPRYFARSPFGKWEVQTGESAKQVPLHYELAYGGGSVVPALLQPGTTPATHEQDYLLNEVCFTNPLGKGWRHVNFEEHARSAGMSPPRLIPAPQIEPLDTPIRELDIVSQPPGPLRVDQMAKAATCYKHEPAGFGPIGRSWTPRIQKAGSYDDLWLKDRWPNLPRDFDMGYWNCAPEDQQIAYPPSDVTVELLNLATPMHASAGVLTCRLPGHRVAILFRLRSGLLIGATPVVDTLHIDATALRIALVWRATVTAQMNVDVAEVRFERDSSRPLFRMAPRTIQAELGHMETRHG